MIDPQVRAADAERILNEPLVKEAFEGVEQFLVDQLKRTALGDVESHHNLTVQLQSIDLVKRQFEKWIRDGQIAVDRRKQTTAWRKALGIGA